MLIVNIILAFVMFGVALGIKLSTFKEVFTSPMRGEAEGIVYSTKPLSYQGQLIDNFFIRFENGRASELSRTVTGQSHPTLRMLRMQVSVSSGVL